MQFGDRVVRRETTLSCTSAERRHSARHVGLLRPALLGLLAIGVGACGLDRWLFETVALRLNTPTPADRDVYHATLPLWDAIRFFPHVVGGAVSFAAVALLRPRGFRRAVIAGAAVLTAALSANLLQDTIGRMRPDHGESALTFAPAFAALEERLPVGFPSGEVATAFALAFALRREFRRRRWAFAALAYAVAVARCLFGMHYFSDVVAGALLGQLLAGATWKWVACRVRETRRGSTALVARIRSLP